MNKKGFFSAIILIFVFVILLFFLYQNLSTNKIVLDDSYRKLVLAQETAYLQLDNIFEGKPGECTISTNTFQNDIDYFNTNNKICKVNNFEKNTYLELDLNCSVESDIGFKKVYTYNQHLIYKYTVKWDSFGSCTFVDQDLS